MGHRLSLLAHLMFFVISRLRLVSSSSSSFIARGLSWSLLHSVVVSSPDNRSAARRSFSIAGGSNNLNKTAATPMNSTTTNIDEAWKATSLSADELIEIVDENNNVVHPPTTRREMRAKKLPHRATYAFVRDNNNYFYVQKRSMIKDYCPGYFDPTPGGVVAAGESYAATNIRECEEEMGIYNTPMEHLFTFYYEDNRIKCWGDAFDCIYDGPLLLQKEEVDSVHMMSMQEIFDRYERGEKFTPDSIHACREYVRTRGMPEPLAPNVKPVVYSEK